MTFKIDHKNPRSLQQYLNVLDQTFQARYLAASAKKPTHYNAARSQARFFSRTRHSKGVSYGPYKISASDQGLILKENSSFKGLKNDFKTIEIVEAKTGDPKSLIQDTQIHMLADGAMSYRQIRSI